MPHQSDLHSLTRRKLLAAAGAVAVAGFAPHAGTGVAQTNRGVTWEELAPGGALPIPRWDHMLAVDESRQRLLLFGGRDGNGAALNDTWLFDLESMTWTQLTVAGPDARFGVAAASDPNRNSAVLFGGQVGDVFYNDVWSFSFDSATWTQLHAGDGAAPGARYGLGGVVDDTNRFFVSHGFTFAGRFDDTWSFDLNVQVWTDVTPVETIRPLNRCLHEQVWDATNGVMILYAGCSSGFGPCPQGDTWAFSPDAGNWVELTPSSGPEARSNPALVQIPDTGTTLVFGGLAAEGPVADTWMGTLADGAYTWTPVDQSGAVPSARSSHDMVAFGDRVYLFGGTGPNGALGDLWVATLS